MTKSQIVEAIDKLIKVTWKDDFDKAQGSFQNVQLCVYKNSVSCVAGRDKSMFTIRTSTDFMAFEKELTHLIAKHRAG